MSVYRMIQYDSYDTYLSIVWFMSIFNMLLRYEIFFTWHDMIFIVRFTKTIFIYMISPPLVKNGWLWAPCVITQINCYTWCVIDFTYIHMYYLFLFFLSRILFFEEQIINFVPGKYHLLCWVFLSHPEPKLIPA